MATPMPDALETALVDIVAAHIDGTWASIDDQVAPGEMAIIGEWHTYKCRDCQTVFSATTADKLTQLVDAHAARCEGWRDVAPEAHSVKVVPKQVMMTAKRIARPTAAGSLDPIARREAQDKARKAARGRSEWIEAIDEAAA